MKKFIFCILFSVLCLLFSSWLMFHTFSYDTHAQSIEIASKLWSDFGSHIPLIRSFSIGANFDRMVHFRLPEYPIFPRAPIRYHFIFYMIVGLLEKAGLRIDWALNVPSIIGFAGLLILIYYLATTLFHNTQCHPAPDAGSSRLPDQVRHDNSNVCIGLLSVLFFLFNGSLSFVSFFQKHPLSLSTLFDIRRNSTFPSFGPWDNSLVSAFWNLNIYTNQRHLAAAFALGIGFIALVLSLEKKSWGKQLPFLLITVPLLSVLPYFHQPMLLIIGLFMLWYFLVFPRLRLFLFLTGMLSAAPIFLQLQSLTFDPSAFAWYPGYLLHGNITPLSFLTYWFYNLGLHLIFIPIGFLIAPMRVKKIITPIFFLFIIANLFKFSVEIAANHKFFNFVMIFGNMLSAYMIVSIWNITDAQMHAPWLKKLRRTTSELRVQAIFSASKSVLLMLLIFFLTLSGIIDFFAVYNDTKIPIPDIPRNEIAAWIATNTPKDAIFLNSGYLYHPASLAGRSIFLGWPYFPWSAGYKENRMAVMKEIYESKNPEVFCPILEKYTISFITVEEVSGNPDLPEIDPIYFSSIAEPSFKNTNHIYLIFSASSLCKK